MEISPEQQNEWVEKLLIKPNENQLDRQFIQMRRELARKQTKWNALENKLFLCALARLKFRNSNNEITLRKSHVCDALEIDQKNANKLRQQCLNMMTKSLIQMNGKDEEEWNDGFLISNVRSTQSELIITFNDYFIPYLEQIEPPYTGFYLENVANFKSKYSIVLYQYLKSWYDKRYVVNHQALPLEMLKMLFGISGNAYVRKSGKKKGQFDTSNFKIKTLDVAIEEINESKQCDLFIEEIKPRYVHKKLTGWEIWFSRLNPDGTRYVDGL